MQYLPGIGLVFIILFATGYAAGHFLVKPSLVSKRKEEDMPTIDEVVQYPSLVHLSDLLDILSFKIQPYPLTEKGTKEVIRAAAFLIKENLASRSEEEL